MAPPANVVVAKNAPPGGVAPNGIVVALQTAAFQRACVRVRT